MLLSGTNSAHSSTLDRCRLRQIISSTSARYISDGTCSVVLYRTSGFGVTSTRRKMDCEEDPNALRDSAPDAKMGVPWTLTRDPGVTWVPAPATPSRLARAVFPAMAPAPFFAPPASVIRRCLQPSHTAKRSPIHRDLRRYANAASRWAA